MSSELAQSHEKPKLRNKRERNKRHGICLVKEATSVLITVGNRFGLCVLLIDNQFNFISHIKM